MSGSPLRRTPLIWTRPESPDKLREVQSREVQVWGDKTWIWEWRSVSEDLGDDDSVLVMVTR